MLIRVPNDGSSATAISIPRDSYVDVPGIGMSKINAAFGATKATERLELLEARAIRQRSRARPSTKAGREALIKSVANLTGITVDHYAEVGLLGFVLLTDAVGGVDVCLNNPVDEWMSGAQVPSGRADPQRGRRTVLRPAATRPAPRRPRPHRPPAGVHGLAGAQGALREDAERPGKLNELSCAVQRSVVLDDDWDIIDFAKQLQDLAGGEVKFQTIPVVDINAMTDYGESIVQVDPKDVRKYVAGLVGRGRQRHARHHAQSRRRTIDASTVTVDVANDSGIGGLANGSPRRLTATGLRAG